MSKPAVDRCGSRRQRVIVSRAFIAAPGFTGFDRYQYNRMQEGTIRAMAHAAPNNARFSRRALLSGLGAAAGVLWLCTASAQEPLPPRLQLPLRCTPNADCWIAKHVDLDPGPGVRDYACGAMANDRHEGVDFALRDLKAMQQGVDVLAAAGGTVAWVRDGEPDASVRERGKAAVNRRECGNGVALAHGGGWVTQYCHLRQASTRVRKGERVSAGQPLGRVGLSGLTEYPHLHFMALHNNRIVDPFGGETGAGCRPAAAPLWQADVLARLPYRRGVIYNLGFSGGLPTVEEVRTGNARAATLPADTAKLAMWVEVFAVAPGDVLVLKMYAPDGRTLMEQKFPFERQQARVLRSVAGTSKTGRWPPGVYRGEAVMQLGAGPASPAPAVEARVELR